MCERPRDKVTPNLTSVAWIYASVAVCDIACFEKRGVDPRCDSIERRCACVGLRARLKFPDLPEAHQPETYWCSLGARNRGGLGNLSADTCGDKSHSPAP